MARVRTVEFLPEIFQTPVNRQFLNATLDQLTQEPAFQKTQGFVGRKIGPGVNAADRYVIEPTAERNNYQLEPGVVSLASDTNNIQDVITYPGINAALDLQGAETNNADRLYTSDYYTWDPFVDFDKFVNYSQYYWLALGPDSVDVFSTGVPLTDNFVVTRANGVYTFSGLNGNNPTIRLARGGSYTFQVAQNTKEDVNFQVANNANTAYVIDFQTNPTLTLVRGNTYTFTLELQGAYPFYIKTQPTLGTTNQYTDGVTNNGAIVGTITFTVPQSAPDTLYYVNPTQPSMQGIMNVINATPGTGPGFWIQTDPGVNGRIPATPNISSRDVLGVVNNGEDLGTVTFNVPLSTAQDFFYTLAPIGTLPGKPPGTVDLITNLKFNQINNQFVDTFLETNPTGIDGINSVTDLDGKTLVFLNDEPDAEAGGWQITTQYDPLPRSDTFNGQIGSYDTTLYDQTTDITSQSERYSVWQIQYVPASNGRFIMQLVLAEAVNNLEKFSILYGTEYSSTQWYKNSSGEFQQIPLLTAVKDLLFYQDGTDPEIFGQIRLIDQDNDGLDIADIIGKKNYTSPNGVVFTNGLKVQFRGEVVPASYQNQEYYVEGVGTAIKLLPVSDFITPETYTQSANVPYDSTPYDVGNYDATLNAPLVPDYLTINRASLDLNAWSRSNRWFHIDVINATAEYNNTEADPDNRLRARRPILEFRAGTKLFDFGTQGKQPVNIIDFEETDAFSNINGTTGYGVDEYEFMPGSRVIFARDTDSQVRNKIWEVQFIVPDTVPPLIAQPIINLVPAADSTVLPNQCVVCVSGATLQGKSFWFDGVTWTTAQDKTGVNQAPLFDVVDADDVSYSNQEKYLSSNFRGSKLFSYATSNLSPDAVLGFPVRYLSLANVGDIVFDNNLYKDTFDYVVEGQGQVKYISEGFVKQYSNRTDYVREIGWQTAATRSLQRQQFQFSYDGSPLLLDVRVNENTTVPAVQLYVNSTFEESENYTYTTTDTTTKITLSKIYAPGDIIEVAVLSDQVSATAFYQVPINLENNPLNANSETFTLGTIRSHYQTIGENLLNIQGPIIGANNTRDLGNIIPYGLQILQQSSPLTLAGYFMRDQEYDIFAALEYNNREYIKFKNLLLETVIRNEYPLDTPVATILDSAIYDITRGRSDINPFYWSDMMPTGVVYTQTDTLITPITGTVFNTVQTYDFTSANYQGLLVYISKILPNQTSELVLLTRGTDYVVSTDAPKLTILTPLVVGETVIIREYSNTAGNFVPNTPTKLGLYPKYVPQQFLDPNYVNPTVVIQGHDGSITVAFNDIRDQVLLEFERRIYNNLKTDDNPVPLTAEDVIPGFFRTTDYTQTEINNILNESFLTWVGWNKLDYTSQTYNPADPFTYNYSSAGNKINGEPLLGAWRGIYEYFYDTTSPNLTPWEMLGLSEKPGWWENRYGPAPYTKDNLVLWDDLELGLVADPVAPYIKPHYARPGLTSVIPVGSEGQLLAPIDSVVGPYDPTDFRKSWIAGDGSPVENTWWTSSSYPFAVMRLLVLTRPAEFFSLFADRDLYRFSTELGQYLYRGRYRLTTADLPNQPIDSTLQIYGNGVSKASYIDWIVDYNQQLGRDTTTQLTAALSHIDVRLCYRMASFTDKQYLKIFVERSSPDSTNSSLLLPDDSFDLFLYKNQPFSRILYSGLVVERTEDGYSVWGYNNSTPYFNILASSSNGLLQTVSGGGAEVRVPAQYTTTVVQVPYGYNFLNTTMVVDFILSYGKYLESQGLIFDDRENGYTLNWSQMATEFLYFSQQGWTPGTLIALNPAATTLRAVRAEAVVDTIISTSPENFILNQNRKTLPTRDLIINREGNEFTIRSESNQTISFLNLRFTNYEDIVVLNNRSIFNDLIYDPTTGARQNRVRIVGSTTTEWNGTLDAQGFILNNNQNVKAWQPNLKYAKGEIVLYKNNYWSAQTIVQPKLEFNYNDWVKSDYTRIQGGLLPNIANKADQLANSYNTQVANLEADNDLLSYGLIGFRPRQYMVDLNLDDVSQVNLYQQFLSTKGTIRAAEVFTNADLGKESGEYNIYENWGVLVSTYGANANRSFIELRLNEAELTADPATVQVITPQQPTQANQAILLGDVWRESYKLTSTDIFPTTFVNNLDSALPSAGYVNLDDIDITVFSLDDPSSISASLDTVGIGTTIWAAKSNSYDWNVYRCSRVPGQLTQLIDNLNGTSIAQFSQVHDLSVGDLIVIRYFNDSANGVYRVLAVPSISSVTIAYSFVNTNQTSITGTGLVFYLQTMRVTQASDVADLPYVNSLIPGALAYVDDDGTGHWEVLEKQDTFALSYELVLDPVVPGAEFGTTVTQSLDLRSVLIGAPVTNSGAGTVYPFGANEGSTGYTAAGQLTLNTVSTVGYGETLAFGKNNWAAIGAPQSFGNVGYVTTVYKNPVTSTYAITQLLNRPSVSVEAVKFGSAMCISQDEKWMYISAPNDSAGGKVYAYGRVDVESQTVSYGTNGITDTFNWSDSIAVDSVNRATQLVVTLQGNTLTEGVDYSATLTDIEFPVPPVSGQTLTIRRRNSVAFTGDNLTVNFPLDPWLYTATSIDSFTVRVNGVIQRPYIDYEFNNDSALLALDLVFNTAPGLGDSIEVVSDTYWQYAGVISATGFDTLPAGAEFGISLATSTDGRQIIIGADKANASVSTAGAVYLYDRSVIRYQFIGSVPTVGINPQQTLGTAFPTAIVNNVVIDVNTGNLWLYNGTSWIANIMPGSPVGPVSVLLNGEFLTVRNVIDGTLTRTQFISGQVDIDYDNNEIVLTSSVTLNVGDNLEIETNQFQPVQKVTASSPAQNDLFGYALDVCSTNCSLYVGAPQDSSTLLEAGLVERHINQSRLYGVTTSTVANPVLTAGDTIRINNIEVAVPASPNNNITGMVSAVNSANIPNVTASLTTNLEFVGNGSQQIFDIGSIYSDASSYTTVVSVDGILQTSGVDYTYNSVTEQINFVTAPAQSSVILIVSGRMVLNVKNSLAATANNQLSVLPGIVNSAFEDLGFDTLVYVQTITSPNPATYAKFGSSISVNTNAINLIVGAPNGNIYEPMTFDDGATRFDDRSTTFFSPVFNSGVAYTYDFLPSANGSVANPGRFVFGQQIYNNNIQSFNEFSLAIDYTNGQLLVGAPKFDEVLDASAIVPGNTYTIVSLGSITDPTDFTLLGASSNTVGVVFVATANPIGITSVSGKVNVPSSNSGIVSIFSNPTNSPAWTILHRQQPVVDVDLLNSVFMYDRLTSTTQTYFDFIDPLQGKILGAARRNIDYIGAVDPANYNIGTVHNQGNSWGSEHVGEIWWDTDTVRFIDPNQDDIVYASRRWAQVFPGSRVDVYQWVESTIPPVNYTGPGVPLSTVSYTVRTNLNAENIFVTSYYFWVRGINEINTRAGKTLSTTGIARYIESPRTSGIPYIAALNSSTVAIYNGLEYLSAADTILHIGYDREFTDANVHQEYQFVADGIADSFLNATLYRKLQDSFCGADTAGALVPDPTLSPAERYGVQFRPRQSMFANRFLALQNYLTRANDILKLYPVVETKNLSLLNSAEPQPAALSAPTTVTISIASPAVITWPGENISINTPIVFSTSGTLPTGITAGTTYFIRSFVSTNNFTISATLGGPVINTSGSQSGVQSGAVIQWNQRVATIEELGYQDLNAVPIGYLYLVESDTTQFGYWDIYQVIESDALLGTRITQLTRIQNYFTPDYWYHIDWYMPGYNKDIQPVAEVPVASALDTLNLFAAPIGSSVKVTANAQGKFEIYLRTLTGWDRVGLQDGTLQFREELWNYGLGGFGFDVEPYDTKGFGFDKEPVIETRKIIQAINEQLFVDDLAIERNRSLILMFNYVYSEFTAPEWLIKTSLIDVQHNIRALLPFQTYLQDNQTFVLDYIQEVKPYHVQIREFNLSYDGLDDYLGTMTDFDVPAYWKSTDIELPQYVSPVLQFDQAGQPYTLSDSLIENTVSDTPPDAEIWTLEPWTQWYNNYLLELESVEIINGGSGYTVPPLVEISGTCVVEPTLLAVINSAGQVVAVDIIDPGQGFSTSCLIVFVGGNGSGARAVGVLGNNLVRQIKTTIKYDRCEYSSTIVDWEPNVSYDTGTQVRYLNRVWSANSGDSTPVSGPTFDPEQWILVNADTLSGADRTMGYYTPTVNMPGLSLPLLIDGIDYPGVQVDAPDFDQDTGYDIGNYDINPWDNIFISPDGYPTYDPNILDAIYASYYPRPPAFPLPVPTGTGATDLNVDGGAYVDTYSSHAPEELIPGAEFDTLDMRVYARPGSDWVSDGHGFPLRAISYTVDAVPLTLSFANSLPVPYALVISNQTQGVVLDHDVDYTINWINQSVTIISDAAIDDVITIDVYGLGGGNQLFQAAYPGDEVGDSLVVDVVFDQIQEFAIFVNGSLTTDYTYDTLWQEPGVTTAYESFGSSGTTLVVASTNGISLGSLIVGTGFSSGQTVVDKFSETILIISAPPDSTPSGNLTFKANTGKTVITFGSTYTSADYLSVTALGPTLVNDVPVNYSWSTAVIQVIISPGSTLSFLLDNSLQYTNPDNLIVMVNGSRARTSAGAEWYGDGSTAYELPTRLGFSQALIADTDVRVYIDDILQTLGVDYVIEPYSPGDNRAVEFLTQPPLGSRILICVITGSQCYVSGNQLIFDPAGGLVPVAGSTIEVITWNDTRQQNILTKVFVGPITTGITLNEPYDSTDYDLGTVNEDPGSYDYTEGLVIDINDFQLGRVITDPNRLWVTLNGWRLFPEVDFTIVGEELVLNSGVIHSLDTLIVTEVADSVVPPAMAFRIFQDMRGLQTTYRITPSTTTTLAQPLTASADVIYVTDASKLTLPVLSNNQWGILTIGGERIMYRERNLANNTVSSLIRGTAGTAAAEHLSGAAVYNMSRNNRLLTEYQNYIVSNLTNDTEIYPVLGDGINTVFVAQDIDNSATGSGFNNESVEVYLGGTRQYSGYVVTVFNPVTVVFDTAPPAGVEVYILVRRGTWWYDIATLPEREQSLQETANPAGRFLRGQ
jgi:hypothetical protein